jgi:secondary thiamine-phosphate synthase enzyme
MTERALRSVTSDVSVVAEARLGILDLTDELRRAIKDSGVTEGCAVAFCAHTTAALLINELEDGALDDFRARLEALVPGDASYSHDDLERRTQNLQEGHERPNGRSHVTQMLVGGSSHAIPVSSGEPMLGRWQRLLLLELDDPKERRVVFHVFGV